MSSDLCPILNMDSASAPLLPKLTAAVGGVAWALAVVGGVILLAVTGITDASILGRLLIPVGLGPIPGDFEMVETGTAFAIFCFLPLCQYLRSHATVDVFTSSFPPAAIRTINLVVDLVFAVVITMIVWRMGIGLGDKLRNGQMTFILQMPVWWTYAGGMVGGAAWLAVSYFCLVESIASLLTGRDPHRASGSEI